MDYIVKEYINIWKRKNAIQIIDEETSTEVAVYHDRVVFHATDSDLDKQINRQISQVKVTVFSEDIKVHSGYFNKYLKIRERLFELLKIHSKVVFLGHSQGGGMAELVAMMWKNEMPTCDVYSYSFSGPKVGDSKFASLMNEKVNCHRIYYGEDPVPLVPFARYKHTGNPYWVNNAGIVVNAERPLSFNIRIMLKWALSQISSRYAIENDPWNNHSYKFLLQHEQAILKALLK